MMMFTFPCLSNKYRCKHGENESLQKCHQHLDEVYKYGEAYCNRHRTNARILTQIRKDEYQWNETDNDNVPRYHVRKKTDNESEGLNEHTEKFNQHQYRLHKTRHAGWIENMSPEMFVGTEQDHDEWDHTKHESESNVAGHIRTAGYQSENIIDENEKEYR